MPVVARTQRRSGFCVFGRRETPAGTADGPATLMQASIAADRQMRFQQSLKEGSLYSLTEFDVMRSNPKYRLSDATLSIRFNDGTFFEKIETTARTIPTELFRFPSYKTILALGNTGKELPEKLGARSLIVYQGHNVDVNVCVSMFDSQALAFHSRLESFGRKPRVVLVTSVNPKIVVCQTSLGLHRRWFTQKIEPLTVSELKQFVITAEPQIIEFLCTAKVTEIQKDEGWCHIGCSKCSKKLIREENSFTCVHCNESNLVAELRYRVILCVSDASDTALFLGFDTEVAKLTLIQASEAAQIVVAVTEVLGGGRFFVQSVGDQKLALIQNRLASMFAKEG
ncbi:unnamed protein product [Eruca vesicaria subsp. sativa]|uniref:Replication factor A C-terminal domain-containing protein n=1 Tax=Eruca vesicaria subsp. sativa TaxID=29727 RepID=A0ABC8LB09_ERUVS|nr:unnamed protein product [Eruca vesicaria subsp. sativa]